MSRYDDIDAIITALGASPTADQMEFALRDFPDREVRTVLAKRAAAGGGGAALPTQWAVDDATGQFVLTFDDDSGTNVAYQIDYVGEPTDYIPLFWIGGDSSGLAGTQVFSIDSTGDSDWYFRDSGVSLKWHRSHSGDSQELVAIGESIFYVSNAASGPLILAVYDDDYLQLGAATSTLSFFAGAGAGKQTGVAVDTAAIHAALVAYGLIAA